MVRVIPADLAAKTRTGQYVYCAGSTLPPTVQSAGHGICPACEQPFRLRHGAIPEHRS